MISPHCEEVLTNFLNKEKRKNICWSFRDIRAVALCRSWEILEKEHIPFREAVRKAWAWVKDMCREVGAYI